MTIAQGFRYYIGGLVACCLLAIGMYILPGGKQWNPTMATLVPGGLSVAGSLIVAYVAFSGLSREDRSKRGWEPVVCLALTAGASAIISPVLYGAKSAKMTTVCISNMRQTALSATLYAVDHDDRFPIAIRWRDLTRIYRTSDEDLRCPTSDQPVAYAMNEALSGVTINQVQVPSFTILFFEAESKDQNPVGKKNDFLLRHNGRGTVSYADGSARLVKSSNPELRWNP